jgi:hypothetical protein
LLCSTPRRRRHTSTRDTAAAPCPTPQALAAHLLNFIDKSLLFRSSAAVSGCSTGQQLLLLLSIKGSARLSLPVLKENLSRVLRGAGERGRVLRC